MKITDTETVLKATKGNVTIKRIAGGVPHISADHQIDLYWGLGYMHGTDRQLSMWLVKLIGQGRASEKLKADEELIAADKYMRWISLGGYAKQEIKKFSTETKAVLNAYCDGINRAVADSGVPFEFKLVGYKPEPWTPEDTVLMSMITAFIGLTQSQGDMEKLIIQMIQEGVSIEKLMELLPSMESPKKELIDVIKKTNLVNPMVPESVKWLSVLTRFSASNNWAVSPARTKSKTAILCGDPHIEINRLPALWYEAVMVSGDFSIMGATLPGLPAVVLGRSNNIAWSVTYGFMDTIDYFIEDVVDKKCLRGKKRVPFVVREEVIRPKKKPPITMKFYESDNGVLEGEPNTDGYWLSFSWSARRGTIAQSMDSILKVHRAKNVKEALDRFSGMTYAAFNWVVADNAGNIGYQMSGSFPKRKKGTSGLLPYFGWDSSQQWKGIVPPSNYPRAYNPPEGYVATANEDFSHLSKVPVQNLPMGAYRGDRIRELLKKHTPLDVEAMKKIQYDLYSLQAQYFMKIIKPLLPDTGNGRILRDWDLRYDTGSLGATLFERVYAELLKIVFGRFGIGTDVIDYALVETGLFNDYYDNFDRILLAKKSLWFGEKTRQEIYKQAIDTALKKRAVPYGKTHKILMANLFFGGKLPRILGFDFGPIELPGNRATIVQGQIFKSAGRLTTFAPSYRLIADLGETAIHTNIPGGPSDRRYSPYYTSDIRSWQSGAYKILKPR
ncbi:MAG: penicillin acylase family protein [Deltaproteobacteria bacterium]|nr:penicillin acylase family protein [Candidatus Zymogenaceae bacterium]